MYIYQLGNTVLKGFAEFSSSPSWRDLTRQGLYSSALKFDSFLGTQELTSLKIRGVLHCDNNVDVEQQLRELIAMGGRPYLDIIGYLPNTCCSIGKPCTTCGGSLSAEGVTWWTTYGQIVSVDRAYQWSVDETGPHKQLEVSLEVIVSPLWMPINLLTWFPYYGLDILDPFDYHDISITATDTAFVTPRNTIPKFVPPFTFEPAFKWVKRNFNVLNFNSQVLAQGFQDFAPLLYPDSTYLFNQSTVWFGNPLSLRVDSPYNGDIYSIYVLSVTANTVFTTANTVLNATIVSETAPGVFQSATSSVLLNATSALVNNTSYPSPANLTTNARIIIQAEQTPFGKIYRDAISPASDFLRHVLFKTTPNPVSTFSTRMPFELTGLRNKLTFTFSPSTLGTNGVVLRQLHIFRRS